MGSNSFTKRNVWPGRSWWWTPMGAAQGFGWLCWPINHGQPFDFWPGATGFPSLALPMRKSGAGHCGNHGVVDFVLRQLLLELASTCPAVAAKSGPGSGRRLWPPQGSIPEPGPARESGLASQAASQAAMRAAIAGRLPALEPAPRHSPPASRHPAGLPMPAGELWRGA